MTTFILASASPARRAVLTAAGVDPEVRVASLNEDRLIAGMAGSEPGKIVTELAVAKAKAVIRTLEPALTARRGGGGLRLDAAAGQVAAGQAGHRRPGPAVLGPDGRPHRHAAHRPCGGPLVDGTTVATADGCESTQIRFGRPSEPELEAYLATGEPLQVAGACTIDGLGGWFIDGVEGDPSSVIGISLPLTRTPAGPGRAARHRPLARPSRSRCRRLTHHKPKVPDDRPARQVRVVDRVEAADTDRRFRTRSRHRHAAAVPGRGATGRAPAAAAGSSRLAARTVDAV